MKIVYYERVEENPLTSANKACIFYVPSKNTILLKCDANECASYHLIDAKTSATMLKMIGGWSLNLLNEAAKIARGGYEALQKNKYLIITKPLSFDYDESAINALIETAKQKSLLEEKVAKGIEKLCEVKNFISTIAEPNWK